MTQDVLYTTFWSQQTRLPPPEVGWLDEDQARAQFEKRDLEIVDAAARDADGTPRPRWVIGIGTSMRIRVQFFDVQLNIWHMVDWDYVDSRLWRWLTYDWGYADTTRHWAQKEATVRAETMIQPDGSGDIEIRDRRTGRTYEAEFSGKVSEDFWLEYPNFGDWAALSDPGPSAYDVAGREGPSRVP